MTKNQKPRYAPTGERIVRTIRSYDRAVLPYGTTVLDSTGGRLRRDPEGWHYITAKGTPHGAPLAVDELDFPLQIINTDRGYHQTRAERRTTDRAARSFEAKKHRHKNHAKTTGRYLGPTHSPGRGAPAPYDKTVNGMTLRQADAHVYDRALARVGRSA